jgi:hypothetical protein
MRPQGQGRIPNWQIIRGVPRFVRGQLARQNIDRELHGIVVASGPVAKHVPEHMADWFYDLRRKQLKVYGGLLRFIDISAEIGTPKELIKTIPPMLDSYIDDVYDDQQRRAA